MTFGQRLRRMRERKGLTQRELANRLGVSFTYVSKLETGASPPPGEKVIAALANALDWRQDEAFGLARKLPSRWLGNVSPELVESLRPILAGEKAAPRPEVVTVGYTAAPTTLEPQSDETNEAPAGQEGRFRAMVDSSIDGIILMNEDLDIIYENPASARLLGYEPGRLAGRDALKIVHADDMARLGKGFSNLLRQRGGTARTIARVRHKDGSWRLIEAVVVNLLHDPAVNGIVLDFRDVTDRGRVDEERARSAAVAETAKRHGLTPTEKGVLALIVEGKSNRQIGEELVTSASTVKFHVGHILGKLAVSNRIEAVATVLQHRPPF